MKRKLFIVNSALTVSAAAAVSGEKLPPSPRPGPRSRCSGTSSRRCRACRTPGGRASQAPSSWRAAWTSAAPADTPASSWRSPRWRRWRTSADTWRLGTHRPYLWSFQMSLWNFWQSTTNFYISNFNWKYLQLYYSMAKILTEVATNSMLKL